MNEEQEAGLIGEPRIRLPDRARAGEVVQVRTLVAHPMETGYRITTDGEKVPRRIIERFRCRYDGRLIVDAALRPAVAANPYLEFRFVADRSGDLVFEWIEDTGARRRVRRRLEVEQA
ncbi:MAG: thiosulfate oxidation carrier complex protein SoxZ [Gammaproteobacteria bacterium]|nr:thiosulfate oxidation carrier complex protein SoxZ [Gammaproteobacteria bacterium]